MSHNVFFLSDEFQGLQAKMLVENGQTAEKRPEEGQRQPEKGEKFVLFYQFLFLKASEGYANDQCTLKANGPEWTLIFFPLNLHFTQNNSFHFLLSYNHAHYWTIIKCQNFSIVEKKKENKNRQQYPSSDDCGCVSLSTRTRHFLP